jgi:hypothetical protein
MGTQNLLTAFNPELPGVAQGLCSAEFHTIPIDGRLVKRVGMPHWLKLARLTRSSRRMSTIRTF